MPITPATQAATAVVDGLTSTPIGELADAAAQQGAQALRERSRALREQARSLQDGTLDYIRREPVRAVAYAAAAGAVAVAVMGLLARMGRR